MKVRGRAWRPGYLSFRHPLRARPREDYREEEGRHVSHLLTAYGNEVGIGDGRDELTHALMRAVHDGWTATDPRRRAGVG